MTHPPTNRRGAASDCQSDERQETQPGNAQYTRKLPLLALAEQGRGHGTSIYPSMATLARMVCLSQKQCRRIVHELRDSGAISIIANGAGGKPGTTPHYVINWDRLTTPAHGSPTTPTDGSPTAPERAPKSEGGRLPNQAETAPAGGSQALKYPLTTPYREPGAPSARRSSSSANRNRKGEPDYSAMDYGKAGPI